MSPYRQFLLTCALISMWGPSFLFIKLAVQDLPPMTIVSLRVTFAAIILGIILKMKGGSLPTSATFWMRTFVMAVFSSAVPFCLFCYAERSIDSALAAILNGSSPMFTAILAQIFVTSDRLNLQKSIGIALSSFGVVLLFAPQLLLGVSGTTLGMSAATIATFCYAISHVYGKLYLTGQKPFVAPTAQFIASSIMLWPFTAWHDQPWTLPIPSASAIFGVFGLVVFGTVFAFILYYQLLEHCGPTAMSMVSSFFPVVGMLLGFLFLDESLTIFGLLASGIIILGMLTVNNVISFGSRKVVDDS